MEAIRNCVGTVFSKYLYVVNNGNRSAQTKGQWGAREHPNPFVCAWVRQGRCRQQFCRNKREGKDLIRALIKAEKQKSGGYSSGMWMGELGMPYAVGMLPSASLLW